MKDNIYIRLLLFILLALVFFTSCTTEMEEAQVDLGYDFQPLEIGLFWIYKVEQVTYFGENDSVSTEFFYKDQLRSFYINATGEQVFILERSKSDDKINWLSEKEYTLLQRKLSLVRTIDNQSVVTLVFPPKDGIVWNGNAYRNTMEDEFKLSKSGLKVYVNQENSDDKITYRDIRLEVYEKKVGMVEKYDEVISYCSRNECLGNLLIDSGYKIQMKLTDYGKE